MWYTRLKSWFSDSYGNQHEQRAHILAIMMLIYSNSSKTECDTLIHRSIFKGGAADTVSTAS